MNRVILGFIVLLFLSCGHSKKDFVAVDFREIKDCNKNGIPNDSSVEYYPIELFRDTFSGFFNGYDIFRNSDMSKKQFARIFKVNIKTLKDTFEVVTKDTKLLSLYSYMYYKMHESVLYSHYLDKEVYRLTSISSNYHSPLVVTIEKYRDSVVLITKQLNRSVDFPFIKNPGPVVYVAPINPNNLDKKEKQRCKAIQKSLEDSIAKIYRNCNYHLVMNKRVRISRVAWDSLEVLVDSAKFWRSKPELNLSQVEADGSRMIFEGHSENGYQIRIIPSLHLYRERNVKAGRDNYDSKNNYTKIFRFIARQTNLKDEDIY
ncbi:MAG: hypothetical protein PHR83_15195 [Paludibacter sp.]|nr:hypothetical protein [Paludibacter sp.]